MQEEFYLRSPEEMAALCAEVPDAVRNSMEIAAKCNVEIEFGKLNYPVFHPPEGHTREGYLRKFLADGFDDRYGMKVRVDGDTFVVESLTDASQLPNYSPPEEADPKVKPGLDDPGVAKAVGEFKGGKVEFRTDRYGNVHLPIGKVSFEASALVANLSAAIEELERLKPSSAKGRYLKKVSISSTMGPGIRIDPQRVSE